MAGVALVSALAAPVTNWDSMSYHLPRVRHWLANGTLALYPSHVLRQICFTPGAEMLIAQLRLVFGTTLFDALPQWLALVGLMAAASLAAERLAGRAAGALAALLIAGMPIAVLEATSAQNDLQAAFWGAAALVFALQEEPMRPRNLFWVWAAVAMANVTKPTGMVFASPALLVAAFRGARPARGAALAIGLGALSFLPVLPQYARNHASFGNPLGVATSPINERFGPGVVLSNALRYSALQVPVVGYWKAIAKLHLRAGADPNERLISINPFWRLAIERRLERLASADEDFAASPIQSLLLVLGAIFLAYRLARGEAPGRDALLAAAALGASWLLFLFLIKWQEWGNRLLLPGIALGMPLAAAFAARRINADAFKALAGVLVATGVLCTLRNVHRPLIPLHGADGSVAPSILSMSRAEAYLQSGYGREHSQAFKSLPALLEREGCRYIGLSLGDDDWEEPWWALTEARIKHVNVANESAGLPQEFEDESLCAVLEAKGAAVLYFSREDLKGYAIKDGRVELPSVPEPSPGVYKHGQRRQSIERPTRR